MVKTDKQQYKMRKVIYLITVASLVACSGSGNNNQATAVEESVAEAVVKVTAERVYRQDIDQISTFTATVEAMKVNNIAPQAPLRIKELYAEVGDHVKEGQKLVDLDDYSLRQMAIQLENNKIEFERVDELYAVGGVSKSEWDARKLAYDISKTNYNNLAENTVLLAPISGIVTARNYDIGDMYSSGNPIYVVEQIRPVKLKVNISEALFTSIKKGMEVDITFDAYGDEQFKGTVSLIYPTIDPQTRTFPVEVKVSNQDEKVRPGMFARVSVAHGTENRVLAPDLAITKQTGSGDRYIFVVKADNTVSYQKVEVGQRLDDKFEIISGVEDGDMVVTSGQTRLNKGKKVEIVK